MVQGFARRAVAAAAALAAFAAFAPVASATIAPSVTLDQSGGTHAGSTVPLGMDLKFAPANGDSPKDLTLVLPPGLLSDASVNGGACLQTTTPTPACQVGSGTVTAFPLGVPLPVSQSVSYDLVAPPRAGDLAGLALLVNGSPSGAPGEVTVRPANDPAGFGLNISFADIPDTFNGLPISVSEIKSTFAGLRLPTSCPSTPAPIRVTADSYKDSTSHTVSAPLTVTGCANLPFSPSFSVSAVKDTADNGVQVITDLTQPASPAQATGRTTKLTFPAGVFVPNVVAVLNGGIMCTDPSFKGCIPIGSVSSSSPLYPKTLVGKAYLTGSLTAPGLALVFPPPFALTLTGKVDLPTNTTTFENVPDIPLTDLQVTLSGGSNSVFDAPCNPSSGTASSTLTSQDGDQTVVASAPFSVAGCPPPNNNPPPPPPPNNNPPPTNNPPPKAGRPQVPSAHLSGVGRGLPALHFKLLAGTNAPKISAFTIQLPRGLAFSRRGLHKPHAITVLGAAIKSVALRGGRLVVTLSHPAAGVVVTVSAPALAETVRFQKRARHHRLGTPKLTVTAVDAAGKHTPLVVKLLRR